MFVFSCVGVCVCMFISALGMRAQSMQLRVMLGVSQLTANGAQSGSLFTL